MALKMRFPLTFFPLSPNPSIILFHLLSFVSLPLFVVSVDVSGNVTSRTRAANDTSEPGDLPEASIYLLYSLNIRAAQYWGGGNDTDIFSLCDMYCDM